MDHLTMSTNIDTTLSINIRFPYKIYYSMIIYIATLPAVCMLTKT